MTLNGGVCGGMIEKILDDSGRKDRLAIPWRSYARLNNESSDCSLNTFEPQDRFTRLSLSVLPGISCHSSLPEFIVIISLQPIA